MSPCTLTYVFVYVFSLAHNAQTTTKHTQTQAAAWLAAILMKEKDGKKERK